jgi:BMFP domain-containing protein YqiC
MKTKRAGSIYPTVDEINALPEKFRQYIHDLVTRCDKSGDVQTIAILREDRDALQRRVEELEAELEQSVKPPSEAVKVRVLTP